MTTSSATESDGQDQFVHLHNHSEYSLLDGYGHVQDMAERASKLGQPAMALTDHGNVYAAIDFYQAASNVGIKPIIGMEGYVAKRSRHERNSADGARSGSQAHITLLAENETGYKNLLALSSKAHLEGFYYRPRVDRELLEELNDGVIVLSGCISGELARDILRMEGDLSAARETAAWYRDVFGDRYYLELMDHKHIPDQDKVNRAVSQLSAEMGIEMVVTNDCHYVHPEDAPHQDVLTCIVTSSKLADSNRLRMEDDSYYIKSAAEMRELFPEHASALRNTLAIAERCDLTLEHGNTVLPKYPTPDGVSSAEYLRRICYEGARDRYKGDIPEHARERLERELHIIEETEFADYFLVVWDIFKFVKQQRILSTVRGSAASSLVLYCLQVTDFDPQEYGLFFERFLNLERREMPDIDMEFADDRRAEVIRYCVERYGSDRVAQITTFGTLRTRAAIRDVARIMEDGQHDNQDVRDACNRIIRIAVENARAQSNVAGSDADEDEDRPREQGLAGIYRESRDLQRLCSENSIASEILKRAIGVEGRVRNVGTHAAGVVISDNPLIEYVALQKPATAKAGDDFDVAATQYSMYPIEYVGLLKMDFLGLTNLAALDRCIKIIAENGGPKIDIFDIPLDDAKTFALMGDGDTFGSFQLESAGMTRYIRELKPTSIMDIAAMIALYRPGPMQHIDQFINCKHGRTPITYPHPSLKNILEETYGVIVYQDQVMLAAQEFAGYTLGEADILRKAMGKKVPEIMAEEERKFIDGAMRMGHTEDEGKEIFSYILPFAGYGFNKAHAVSYAYITYWTTYFKAHYPLEYFVALLDSFVTAPDRVRHCILQAKQRGIPVMPPDINISNASFTLDNTIGESGGVRYGLGAVKSVSTPTVLQIVAARDAEDGGAFKDMGDFCERIAHTMPSDTTLRGLIMAGAFDSMAPRSNLLDNLPKVLSHVRTVGAARAAGQGSMFGGSSAGEAFLGIEFDEPKPNGGVAIEQLKEWERDLLGLSITEDPEEASLRQAMQEEPSGTIVFSASEKLREEGKSVRVIGKLTDIQRRSTRNGSPFLAAKLAMLDGEMSITVWSQTLEKTEGLWYEDVYIVARGSIRMFSGETTVDISSAEAYRPRKNGTRANASARANGRSASETASHHRNGAYSPNVADNGSNGYSNGHETKSDMVNGDTLKQGEKIMSTEATGNKTPPAVTLTFSCDGERAPSRTTLQRVLMTLASHRGDETVQAKLRISGKEVIMQFPFYRVTASDGLRNALCEIIGRDNVAMEAREADQDA